jgi:hypothetical protein
MALVIVVGEARADCPRTAVPDGDPALVTPLAERLAASGIATTSTAGCPTVSVHVEQRGEQIHLRVSDAFDRLGERDVRDVETAAAVIESWTLQQIDEGPLPAPPIATPAAITGIGAGLRSAIASNSTTWLGAAVTGCVRVGWACAGGTAELSRDIGSTGVGNAAGLHAAALATLDVPRRLGGFVLRPGVGLGYGWLQVLTTHMDAHGTKFDGAASSHELRAAARVALSRSVARRLAIYGELAGEAALAHTAIATPASAALALSLGARVEVP